MSVRVTDIIEAAAPETRDLAIERWCAGRPAAELLAACAELETYRRREANLYRRVRALFFLAAIHRYHLPARPEFPAHRPRALRRLQPHARTALRGGHQRFSARPGGAGRQRNAVQRAGRGLPRARFPDPRRPGAPHRARHARQRLDVPPRPSARPAAARAARAAARAAAATRPIPSCASAPRCGWT